MNVRIKRIGRGSKDYKRIKALYLRAFPAEERAPFFMLSAKSRRNDVDFWGLYDDTKWVGLMYVVNYGDLSYVFYFAVDESARGRGCGSGALKTILKKYKGRRVFLAIERTDERSDNHSERVKRKRFYMNNGFEETGLKLREGKVVYEVLASGGAPASGEYEALMENYLGGFLSRIVSTKILR